MASTLLLLSTGLMALALLLVVAEVTGTHRWKRYVPTQGASGAAPAGGGATGATPRRHRTLGEVVSSQSTWLAVFVLLVVALVAAIVAVLGGSGPGTAAVVAILGVLFAGYLVVGSYVMARSRGHSVSRAVIEAAAVLAALYVLTVAVRVLALGGG